MPRGALQPNTPVVTAELAVNQRVLVDRDALVGRPDPCVGPRRWYDGVVLNVAENGALIKILDTDVDPWWVNRADWPTYLREATVDDLEPMVGLHESVALALCHLAGIDPDTLGIGERAGVRISGPGHTPIRVVIERSDAGRLYTWTAQR